MSISTRRLPDAELDVMQAIWEYTPPVSKDDVAQLICETHPMAVTTLQTMLSRLTDKGFLRVELRKRKKYYTPCVSREEYLAAQSRRFLDQLCGGSIPTLASALCGSGLTREEIAELRALLERGEL